LSAVSVQLSDILQIMLAKVACRLSERTCSHSDGGTISCQ